MKSTLILLFLYFSVFLVAQQSLPCFIYINNRLQKTTTIASDSLPLEQIFSRTNVKHVVLDSVKQTEKGVLVYLQSVADNVILKVQDSVKQVLFEKKTTFSSVVPIFSSLIKDYSNKGFPFAKIELTDIQTDSTLLALTYTLYPFKKITYDSLDIIGKPLVSKTFLMTYLGIKPSKTYKEKEIKAIDKNLDMLPFYKRSQPTNVFFINDKAKPRIFLEKNNANQFSGVAALSSSNENRVTIQGDVQIQFNNFFKHADSWNIQWKKLDVYSQSLLFDGLYPYLFSYPVGISGNFSLIKQDTSYINLRYRLGINFYTNAFNGIGLFYENKQTNRLTYQSTVAPTQVTLAGIQFKQYYVNHFLLPSKGWGVNVSMAYGQKKLTTTTNVSEQLILAFKQSKHQFNATAESFFYVPLVSWFVLNLKATSAYMNVAHVRNELYRLGGSHSIRGFDEESLWVQSYVLGTIEPTFIIEKNLQAILFFDKMYYTSLNRFSDSPYAFGAGIKLNTGSGLFFISYALGSQLRQAMDFRTAKVHLGYKNNF